MRDSSRSRSRAVSTFVFVLVCMAASFGACAQYKRVTGEDCLKDNDCLTGICSAQVCANAPPLLPSGAGYGDAGADTAVGNLDSSSAETSSGGDSSSDATDSSDGDDGPAADAGQDASDSATTPDASDAAGDASDDASDGGLLDVLDLDVKLDVNLPG